MKIKSTLFAFALLIAGGTSYAEVVGGRVFCAPSLDGSGKLVTQCSNAPEGGDGDPGPGGWQTPEPGWLGTGGIAITSATYGGNCHAQFGNALYDFATACDGAMSCSYTVDYRVLGDPAPGCAKNFSGTYMCPGSSVRHAFYLAPEAGFDKVVNISCQ